MATPFGKTADGFETQFGTNHLGHFVLVNRIASLMKPGARLVNLSSAGHQISDVDLDDPNFERTPYSAWDVLWAVEDRQHPVRGRVRPPPQGIAASARPPLHPGAIHTELSRYLDEEAQRELTEIMTQVAKLPGAKPIEYKSVPAGAATSVWAAAVAKADAVGGRYCEDCHVAEVVDVPGFTFSGVRPYALNPERAKALWAKSEELVGERFA